MLSIIDHIKYMISQNIDKLYLLHKKICMKLY